MEIMTTKWNFNPRSHEGSDQERLEKLLHCLNFNPRSHEGSDLQKTWCLLSFTDFNPRSHEGSDVCLLMPMPLSGIFQSTLPRGERQSTASASSDTSISIHAPTRGATNLLQLLVIFVRFQSTLPRGERHILSVSNFSHINFNPRSHEGSDVHPVRQQFQSHKFQSTLPRGERHKSCIYCY